MSLKKSSCNIDEIPVKILRLIVDIISYPLSCLINLSFSSGVFPESLKLARIIPVFKQGAKENIGNYRPISILLHTYSKIFEKCMSSRLINYLDSCQILSYCQFGFRKGISTDDAINTLAI